MTGKSVRKIIKQLLRMCYVLKNAYKPCLHFKTQLKSQKPNHSLMIPNNREGWHYLTVKELSALLRGVTSKHAGDF